MVNDPIADFLIRIKNGYMAHLTHIVSPYSKMRENLAKILKENGYIASFEVKKDAPLKKDKKSQLVKKSIIVQLKYEGNRPAMEQVVRVSRPGQRNYAPAYKLPRVMTGYGISVISTSRGVMTDAQARKAKIGGEIICKIW